MKALDDCSLFCGLIVSLKNHCFLLLWTILSGRHLYMEPPVFRQQLLLLCSEDGVADGDLGGGDGVEVGQLQQQRQLVPRRHAVAVVPMSL